MYQANPPLKASQHMLKKDLIVVFLVMNLKVLTTCFFNLDHVTVIVVNLDFNLDFSLKDNCDNNNDEDTNDTNRKTEPKKHYGKNFYVDKL